MDVSWNGLATSAIGVSGGTLTIRDGPMVRVISLTQDQLRSGHVWFAPIPGNDLDLRLEVTEAGGGTEVESVQVLGWDHGTPAGGNWARAPDRSREVARLLRRDAAPPQDSLRIPVKSVEEVTPPVTKLVEDGKSGVSKSHPPVQTATPQTESSAAPTLAQSSPFTIVPVPPGELDARAPAASNPVSQLSPRRDLPATSAPASESPHPQAAPPAPDVPEVAAPSKNATPAYLGPSATHKVSPSLTEEARGELRRAVGKVVVSVRLDIDESGNVRNAVAESVSGQPGNGGAYLKLTALAAARRWRFRPASINGNSAPSQMTVQFQF
jgi:TonB family protein